MIVKTFELKKIKLNSYRFFLIYGNNKGFIEEIVENNLKPILFENIYNYDENEILQNSENFEEDIAHITTRDISVWLCSVRIRIFISFTASSPKRARRIHLPRPTRHANLLFLPEMRPAA